MKLRTFSLVLATLCLVQSASVPRILAATDDAYGPNMDVNDFASRFLARFALDRDRAGDYATTFSGEPGADKPLGGWNEEMIAVNPTNPLNIAYADLFQLRVSTDGGTTWQPAVQPKTPAIHIGQGDPCVAFDSQGRLFWSYLGAPFANYLTGVGFDVFIAQCDPATGVILPGYPVNVTAQIGVPATAGNLNDKEWLAADWHVASPFADRLYLVWTKFPPSNIEVTLTSHSSDHGQTWSAPLQLGASTSTTFIWPTHIAVAPNGDVYAADHRQAGFSGGAPNGVSGFVTVFRSTDGGATFPQQTQPFTAGKADMTFNVQTATGPIPGAKFWLQGSVQPWVLPDPNVPGRVHVVSNDDPDNNVASGDAADVFIATSNDFGNTWSAPVRVDHGPGTTYQVMPVAAIDPASGAIVVQFYDNRSGAVNGQGNALLDVYATMSIDGGAHFYPDFKINDVAFDPDAGARCRFGCGPLISDVWAAAGGKAFAVTTAGHFLIYNGGWSIGATSAVAKWGIWGASDTDVFTCGAGGEILHYNGSTLTGQTSGTPRDLYGIDGRTGSDVYAVGALGTVLHYDGVSWSALTPGTSRQLHDVWANPAGAVFVVGDSGAVLRYNGAWTDVSIGTVKTLEGVWGAGDSDVYATSTEGLLYHWNGLSWTSIDAGTPLLGVWGRSSSDILALGFGRAIRYDGVSLSNEEVSEHLLVRGHGTAPSNVFVVGENGEIMRYDGSSWTRQSNPLSPTNPSRRIGEYNGAASNGGSSFVVWCGNTWSGPNAVDQQAIFDSFQTQWQTGVDLVDLFHRTELLVLDAPQPNPAGRSFVAKYALPRASTVDLALMDVQGRRVATLARGAQPAGRHIVAWEAPNAGAIAAGVYLLRLTDGKETVARRVIMMGSGGR